MLSAGRFMSRIALENASKHNYSTLLKNVSENLVMAADDEIPFFML